LPGNDSDFDIRRSVAIEYLLLMTRASRSEVTEHPEGWIVKHPTIDWPVFNWALPKHESPAAFAALRQVLSEKGLRPSFVVRGDASEDALSAMGLAPRDRHVVMLAETKEIAALPWLSPGPRTFREVSAETSVRRITDGRSEWLELLLDGFEVPETMRPKFISAHSVLTGDDPRAYLYEAVVSGERVGACFMWVENGIAGIHTASVLPAYRGRGVHKVMFEARLKEALRLSDVSGDINGAPSVRWIATETAIPSVERTASSFGLKPHLEYRFWY
jgi:GNAT superfamily N-acetyltransferase